MKTISIHVDDIVVGERHRALSNDAVQRLAGSLGDIGLKQPISVRVVDEMELHGEMTSGVPVLVAGAHRLAAAKQLGWSHIDCIEVEDDDVQAELWEIAENLHRHDLTKDQRDEHIRRYAELLTRRLQSAPVVPIESKREDGRGHKPKGIATQIAEETGLSYKTVQRAINNVSRAEPPKEVFDVHEQARRRLMSAWNGATEEDRQWFRDWIETPIMDGPVFDRSRCA